MLKGKPSGESDAVTMQAIKSILADFEDEFIPLTAKATTLSARPAPLEDRPHLAPVQEVGAKLRPAKFTTVPPSEVPADAPRNMGVQAAVGHVPSAEYLATRSTAQAAHVERASTARSGAICVLAVCALWYPQFVVVPAAAVPATVLFLFILLGRERLWAGVARWLAWYTASSPARGARLIQRFDRVAAAWDAVLDRFPSAVVGWLYLPDFAENSKRTQRIDAVLASRLRRMHSQV